MRLYKITAIFAAISSNNFAKVQINTVMKRKIIYYFDEAYGMVPTAKTKECREKLIDIISPGRNGTFYTYLARGICNIRLPLYEAITDVFLSYGIPESEIWRKEIEE